MTFRQIHPTEIWHLATLFGRSHIRPKHGALYRRGICCQPNFLTKSTFGWLGRKIDAIPINIELPAVINTADTAIFVAPEEQICAAMRAVPVHQADSAFRIAKGDQVFAEQAYAHRRAVGLQALPRA